MVDISSQEKKINIKIQSGGVQTNVGVTQDTAQYYSEKSKEWAISNRIVDNTDYSSKYYANESKKQADVSTAKAAEVVESGNNAVSNIESARDNAIIDITNQESLSVDNVNTAGATQIALATEQANIATQQATIATSKTTEVVASGNEALNNIDTAKTDTITDITDLKNTSISDITTAKDNAITTITTQETTSKNNVIATGNEQVDRIEATGNNYDNLTHKNITNCLLEVPQRIKYDLTDGTLTIKAGSVVIVPYGVEDLTSQYPVGSVFINDNFRVYDTQFEDGKFFVWAELQEDKTGYPSGTFTRLQAFDMTSTTGVYSWNATNLCYSGSSAPTNTGSGSWWYDTTNNIIKRYNGSIWENNYISLPTCVFTTVDGSVTSIDQVFNGMGYIGSTVWVDKGVKGLIPNGRNEDGTLNNIEFTTQNILLRNNTEKGPVYLVIADGGTRVFIAYKASWVFDEKSNHILADGVIRDNIGFYGDITLGTDGVISNFNPKLPFRAVDYSEYVNDIDGEYTSKNPLIISSKENLRVATGVNVNYNLSDFLPKDNNSYLVLTSITVQTGDSAKAYCHVWTTSSDSVEGISCGGNTTSAARQTFISNGWTLVRPDRILRTFRSCSGSAGILHDLRVNAYRKVR